MDTENKAVELATDLTVAWLSNPNTRTSANEVPAFLEAIHDAVAKLSSPSVDATPDATAQEFTPAVSVRKSLANKGHIISMIDGKPYKTLRRHLSTNGLTPEAYRERYGLRSDYPMVAEDYSEARRAMAKKIGLGRKPGQTSAETEAPVEETEPVKNVEPVDAAPAKPKPRVKRKAKPVGSAEAE